MAELPIVHMTLYKHGVGFFERRAELGGEEVELSFRVEEMNDVLKSLTAIDRGGGQILGIDYATPQTREERLAGCSIRLGDDRSLQDLLVSLRGRRVRLILDQEEEMAGVLVGLDEVTERQPLATSLVSLLQDGSAQVQTVGLGRVLGVEILDERGAGDLRFFLETALTQEAHRQVTIRLSPGQHDLSVSYVAPAPTWRISYRLVMEGLRDNTNGALLQGWGIFDNRLEEDLQGISLSLVAGMPISFIYDLYTPFTPERPVIEEEARVAAAPVEFAAAKTLSVMEDAGPAMRMAAMAPVRDAAAARMPLSRESLEAATLVETTAEDLGELFQYTIGTPVTVRRGHSAMVPIVSTSLERRKDLLYNGTEMPKHPVATLRMQNETGLTLERGPVTVIEDGEYVGEAVLPFTAPGGEVVVPYAVELGVRVHEEVGSSRQTRGLGLRDAYLLFEEWDVRWKLYQLNNNTDRDIDVLVEHRRTGEYDLFDTPKPQERSDEHLRFSVSVPAHEETQLRVQERKLVSRREELRKQSYRQLQRYLRQGLINEQVHQAIVQLLKLWEQVADSEKALQEVGKERQKLHKAQQQIQKNMGVLSTTGKEGALRSRYVDQLEASEDELGGLEGREADLKREIERLRAEIAERVKSFA